MRRISLLLILLCGPVFAGDRITQDVQLDVAGDESLALAFAHGMGDVDINDCLASTQWGSIIVSRQKVVLNLWCAAETFDAKAMYQMAAIMRCDIEEISRHFTTGIECIRANTFTPPPPDVTGNADVLDVPAMAFLEAEEDHDESIRELEARLEKVEAARRRPAPAPAVNATGISNEQRQQIAEVFEK